MEQRSIGREIKGLNNRIKRTLDGVDSIRQSNALTGMHGYLLGFLYANRDKDIFQRDIEKAFDIRRSTVTEIVNLMESNGLIVRQSVAQDRRLKRLVLTERAYILHSRVADELAFFESRLREGIAAQDLACFFRVITAIGDNLRKIEADTTL